MNNLELYEKVRSVPSVALKSIKGGRLKGMTDINPMWRIKTLTEQFGICGIGWKPKIKREWLDKGENGEIIANLEIELYVKVDGQWSDGIPGVGGSKFISKEEKGLYTDDECYKKAYTDALSVACKLLGIGADIYFEKDRTKYDDGTNKEGVEDKRENPNPLTREELKELGVADFKAFGEWVRKNYKKAVLLLTEGECDEIRDYLAVQKEKREKKVQQAAVQAAYEKAVKEGDDVPF